MINVFQPRLREEEVDAVRQVMESNWIGRGKKVAELERVWADHIGVPAENVIATTCATEGLFQIMATLLTGDTASTVVMPANSFVGAANAVSGLARINFCDVDPFTMNPTLLNIKAAMSGNVVAVVLNHYGGVPVDDIVEISKMLRNRGIKLIEDCATVPLSSVHGIPVGTFGDFAVWSFDAMKIISGGDGGLIYARDSRYVDMIRLNTYLGQSSASGLSSTGDRWWEFQVVTPGRRAIMNDITAATILAQYSKLDEYVLTRRHLTELYNSLLKDGPGLGLPVGSIPFHTSSYYAYWVQTPFRDGLAHYLRERDIYTTYRYHALTKTNMYRSTKYLPGIDFAQDNTLWLPLHQSLPDEDVEYICHHVTTYMKRMNG